MLQRDGRRSRLTTITVSTNDRPWLAECLSTLTRSDLGDNLELDIVLVDNASTDGSASFVEDLFPTARVFRNSTNLGFAGANNVGIRDALARGADYILLVNPDTRTPPDLLRGLVDFMRDWSEYGIVGPLQYTYTSDGSPSKELNAWSRAAILAGENHIFHLDWPDHSPPPIWMGRRAPGALEHAYVQGSALLCRAQVFRDIGIFDPAYHTYYEEADLCRRARYARWRVALILDLGIQHYGEGGTASSTYRRRHMLRNKYYFLFTDPEWSMPRIVRLTAQWITNDLRRRGAAPAPTRLRAAGDTARGLVWLVGSIPRMTRHRRRHRAMLRQATASPRSEPAPSASIDGARR